MGYPPLTHGQRRRRASPCAPRTRARSNGTPRLRPPWSRTRPQSQARARTIHTVPRACTKQNSHQYHHASTLDTLLPEVTINSSTIIRIYKIRYLAHVENIEIHVTVS